MSAMVFTSLFSKTYPYSFPGVGEGGEGDHQPVAPPPPPVSSLAMGEEGEAGRS